MKLCANSWLPDSESDSAILFGGTSYQSFKLKRALKYVTNTNLAIDVGAHCGLWTAQLCHRFGRVECFEPLPMHIECWKQNISQGNCVLHEVALGDRIDTCGMNLVSSYSGRSHIKDGDGPYNMARLDDFCLENVGFIKIDVEGYEYFVIRGGEETIIKSRPVMIVEQKPGHGERYGLGAMQAVKYLESLGARVKEEIAGDYIMVWDEA